MRIFTFLLLSLLIGCSQTREIPKDKIDAALTKKITELQVQKSGEKTDFIGTCISEINTPLRLDIESAGINIKSVSKNIFTGNGDYNAIITLAGKDYIKWLEAPREFYPQK